MFKFEMVSELECVIYGSNCWFGKTMGEDRKTILVVDDEPGVLSFVEEMLVQQGYRPLLAKTAEEALEVCEGRELNIDLLITDVFLPSMKGNELGYFFKENYPSTKILYMSGYFGPAISEEEQRGMKRAFIQKPFTTGQFMKLFRALVK
jgi:two-component system cell cycle sensor histidine kinase/response regulator CckA